MTTNTDTHAGGVEAVREAHKKWWSTRGGIGMACFASSGDQERAFAKADKDFAFAVAAILAASPAAEGVGARFTALRVAYKRGVAWAIENPGANSSLVEKAAYDYADKATSVALIDEHLTPGFSDEGDCCAGKLSPTTRQALKDSTHG